MLRELDPSSLLVLYVADELSPQERRQVEQQLAADASLRAELAQLESAVSSFEGGMAEADAAPLAGQALACRRIGSAMRQTLARRRAIPAVEKTRLFSKYPKWTPMAGAAAGIVVGMLTWWGHLPSQPLRLSPMKLTPDVIATAPTNDPSQVADAHSDDADVVDLAMGDGSRNTASLEVAEKQIAELTDSRSESLGSYLSVPDTQ